MSYEDKYRSRLKISVGTGFDEKILYLNRLNTFRLQMSPIIEWNRKRCLLYGWARSSARTQQYACWLVAERSDILRCSTDLLIRLLFRTGY